MFPAFPFKGSLEIIVLNTPTPLIVKLQFKLVCTVMFQTDMFRTAFGSVPEKL